MAYRHITLIFRIAFSISPALGLLPPALTTCPGPCTITQATAAPLWADYEVVILSHASQIASLSSSLSASRAAAIQSGGCVTDFVIATEFPKPKTIRTGIDGCTTVTCCGFYQPTAFILNAPGTTCGVAHKSNVDLGLGRPLTEFEAFHVTIASEENESATIAGNQCATSTAGPDFFEESAQGAMGGIGPPTTSTKTMVPSLVPTQSTTVPAILTPPVLPIDSSTTLTLMSAVPAITVPPKAASTSSIPSPNVEPSLQTQSSSRSEPASESEQESFTVGPPPTAEPPSTSGPARSGTATDAETPSKTSQGEGSPFGTNPFGTNPFGTNPGGSNPFGTANQEQPILPQATVPGLESDGVSLKASGWVIAMAVFPSIMTAIQGLIF